MKLISKVLRITRVKGITQFYQSPTCLCMNGISHPALTSSRRESPQFGWYSFPILQRLAG